MTVSAPATFASGSSSSAVLPKSRVNVVATIKDRTGNKARVVTVLQDVLVLAVDTMNTRPEDKMAYSQLNAALLAVKPSESQRLTLAHSLSGGDVRLVLRAHDDESRVPLPPLEDLSQDFSASSLTDGSDGAPASSFKLAVARKDLEAGQVIDDPEKFFEVKTFPTAPEKAVAAEDLGSLRGKTLKHTLFKDSVLTAKHFDGDAKMATAQKAENKRHVLYIQNGGGAPTATVYENGTATAVEPKEPAAEPAAEQPRGK